MRIILDKAERSRSKEEAIKLSSLGRVNFWEKSGGKAIVAIKRIAPYGVVFIFLVAVFLAWYSPKDDHTYYHQGTPAAQKKPDQESTGRVAVTPSVAALFGNGEKKRQADRQKEQDAKRKKVSIRYLAQQVLGVNPHGPKAIKAGAKLIGVLMSAIDTRAPSIVRIKIPQGGEAGGVTIERGSVLIGRYSYPGSGERVYFTFSRIDSPDGDSKKIGATALNSGGYTPGISGEEFTGNGVKVAASLGLTMFSGMTDTLTERESLGYGFNTVQASPSMKNALLQGLSQASKDQASRTAASIGQEKNYVVIPEGQEMIVELSEDFQNGRAR